MMRRGKFRRWLAFSAPGLLIEDEFS